MAMTRRQTCRGYGRRDDCDVTMSAHLMEGGLCPKCRELERTDAEREHRITRDPTLEPW